MEAALNDTSTMAGPEGQSSVAPVDPVIALVAEMPLLVEQAGRLVQAAAHLLGMDDTAARLAARTATLVSGDKTVTVLPMGRTDDDGLSLVISVQTRVPVPSDDGPGGVLSVLQHVPGALHAFSAAPGASADGFWTVHRTVRIGPDGAPELAERLVETVRLADYMLLDEADAAH